MDGDNMLMVNEWRGGDKNRRWGSRYTPTLTERRGCQPARGPKA